MCGRFTQRTPAKRLAKEFQVEEMPPVEARYNIAPTQPVLGVHVSQGIRRAGLFKWGLVPSWAKDPSIGARLINARSETVAEKPAFRDAFRRRRCLIPADGFYEWQRTGGRKRPFFFSMGDGRPFAFAGLWDRWEGEDGQSLETCAILTTEANDVLRPVHDRMPVILRPETYDLWLSGEARESGELLRPYPASEMVSHPVSPRVNNPANQGAELIEELK